MLENAQLLSETREEVRKIFMENKEFELVYHNYNQTAENVEIARDISESENIDDDNVEEILFAVWFLYTGYTRNYDNPFQSSAEIAEEYLKEKNCENDRIKKIKKLILSVDNVEKDKSSESIAVQVVHDAHISFLGRKRFFRLAELWRIEKEQIKGDTFLPDDWYEEMMDLLALSDYYTPRAKELFLTKKHKNILKQRKNLEKATKTSMRIRTGKDFGRGIDTLYRNTLRGHLDLSSIADGKANMIISINTLVLSILITAGSASISISNFDIQENIQFITIIKLLIFYMNI